MRDKWSTESAELQFGNEDAYRFAKKITQAGATCTFSTTTNDGTITPDEHAILTYVNKKMLENEIDFTPYVRPAGAFLVGEKAKTPQSITMPNFPSKEVGDADFTLGATASSGFTVTYISSNPKVATIVNNKVHFVGAGLTRITARQNGDDQYRHAPFVTRLLTVTDGSSVTTNK